MKDNPFTVQEQVVIVRQYKGIGITSKLQAFHLPTAQALLPRYYNGRIAWQYKNLRVGLTTLRRQPAAALYLLYTFQCFLFNYYLLNGHRSASVLWLLRARLPCCSTLGNDNGSEMGEMQAIVP